MIFLYLIVLVCGIVSLMAGSWHMIYAATFQGNTPHMTERKVAFWMGFCMAVSGMSSIVLLAS